MRLRYNRLSCIITDFLFSALLLLNILCSNYYLVSEKFFLKHQLVTVKLTFPQSTSHFALHFCISMNLTILMCSLFIKT